MDPAFVSPLFSSAKTVVVPRVRASSVYTYIMWIVVTSVKTLYLLLYQTRTLYDLPLLWPEDLSPPASLKVLVTCVGNSENIIFLL